jgi:hypothetical protein
MARAAEPTPTRQYILRLALALRWPPSEVARLTYGDLAYLARLAR